MAISLNPAKSTTSLKTIPVMEQFLTLQGEGYWTGTAAYFIRLAGCDVGCVWCDVKDSWEAKEDQYLPIEELVQKAKKSGAKRVVITGGEPTMYSLDELTDALHDEGLKVHIETSGTHPFSGTFDWICLSPKKFKPVLPEYFQLADELKVIVFNQHDFKWGEEQAAKCDSSKTVFYFQPEWSKKEITIDIVKYIKANPAWRLSLQTHKYIDIP